MNHVKSITHRHTYRHTHAGSYTHTLIPPSLTSSAAVVQPRAERGRGAVQAVASPSAHCTADAAAVCGRQVDIRPHCATQGEARRGLLSMPALPLFFTWEPPGFVGNQCHNHHTLFASFFLFFLFLFFPFFFFVFFFLFWTLPICLLVAT